MGAELVKYTPAGELDGWMHWVGLELSAACRTTVMCAGGAVRDLILGRTPKDFDFFVLGDIPSEDAADTAAAIKEHFSILEDYAYRPIGLYGDYVGGDAENDRLGWVLKASISGRDVDIICFTGSMDPEDQVLHFDCNMSQAWIDPDTGERRSTTYFQRGRINKVVRPTLYMDGEGTCRIQYIADKLGYKAEPEIVE